MLELPNKSEKVLQLAWEPRGSRFAVLHGEGSRPAGEAVGRRSAGRREGSAGGKGARGSRGRLPSSGHFHHLNIVDSFTPTAVSTCNIGRILNAFSYHHVSESASQCPSTTEGHPDVHSQSVHQHCHNPSHLLQCPSTT